MQVNFFCIYKQEIRWLLIFLRDQGEDNNETIASDTGRRRGRGRGLEEGNNETHAPKSKRGRGRSGRGATSRRLATLLGFGD